MVYRWICGVDECVIYFGDDWFICCFRSILFYGVKLVNLLGGEGGYW